MMWRGVDSDLVDKSFAKLELSELRWWVERWFNDKLGGLVVRCEDVTETKVVVRIRSAAIHQEVRLLEHALKTSLKDEFGLTLHELQVH